MNLWPPFRGAGIRVREISPDWRSVRVELVAKRLNRNYVGVHFGGSLFSMADPFLMLMYIKALGPEYVVWDHSASIRFVRPGKGTVRAEFQLDESMLEEVRRETAGGERYLKTHTIAVLDEDREVVARIERTVYFRRKPRTGTEGERSGG
jgi:acyl-coenzyme A thioesterase PaaI-like protein